MTQRSLLALLAVLAMVAAACTTEGGSDAPDDRLSVVVTTTIWGDIVSNVAGDGASVEVLFPIGADPHDYQLSAAQAAAMESADLVVVNGLALEEGILDVIEGLEDDGANVLEVAALLDPIPLGEGGHAHDDHDEEGEHAGEAAECDPEAGHDDHDEEAMAEDEHEHPGGSCDPHIWMDPLRIADAAELIAEELAALDSSVDWAVRASAYAEE
ncbi:MAG: metal ABC transporter substrate-binding protein, partial [Acidimicrobiia bacterium]|nr:metal ABC transporter substrate-binding protein [Acidimicrobiia bacterium]